MPETAAKPSERPQSAEIAGADTFPPEQAQNAPVAKKKLGAPKGSGSKYTEEIADQICELVSNGVNLRSVCRMEGMPSWRTVYNWVVEKPDFGSRLARARELGYDAIAEEALEISNTPKIGTKKVYGSGAKEGEDSLTMTEEDMLGHRKLQIETRLKLLACWNPAKYGNRTVVSGDDKAPVVVEASFDVFGEMLKALSMHKLEGA